MTERRLDRRTLISATLGFGLLAIAVTWPLVIRLDQVPHDLGDPLLSTTVLWWNAHVLPLTQRWWDGPWFYPAPGSLAFSDPRLGASLLATPMQWLGTSPLVAYNLTLIASFPLSALAAFVLAWRLTGRRDAAALGGLAFGFTPYRIAHIEHLELLLAWGLPLALYALHAYVDTRERRWLWLLAVTLLLQGLSSSYYLLFFAVLMLAWMAWVVHWGDRRAFVAIAVASFAGTVILAPVYLGMWRIHQRYAFERASEVTNFSADLNSYMAASPLLALWGWTSRLNDGGERQTFLGLTIVLLAFAGAVTAFRARTLASDRYSWWSRGFAMTAAGVTLVGLLSVALGPFDWRAGPLRLTIGAVHKTLSIAGLCAIIALALSARARDAWHRRSLLAFYGLATALLVLCSLGPQPRAFGQVFLYQPPYAWLMALPGFAESIRVPARFAMVASLTLSVAAALAYARLMAGNARRREPGITSRIMAVALLTLIAAESWPRHMPLLEPPAAWSGEPSGLSGVAAVIELPLGLVEYDSAAMYRSLQHRRPTVNGMSGSAPPHYRALSRALLDRDASGLTALGSLGSLLVAAREDVAEQDAWSPVLDLMPAAQRVGAERGWTFFRLEPAPEPMPACTGTLVAPLAVRTEHAPVPLPAIVDGNPDTTWFSHFEAPWSEALVIDLGERASGRPQRTCGLMLSLGAFAYTYPGQLAVDVSTDGEQWTLIRDVPMAAAAIRGALRDQADARIDIDWDAIDGRWIRLRRRASAKEPIWALAELRLKHEE